MVIPISQPLQSHRLDTQHPSKIPKIPIEPWIRHLDLCQGNQEVVLHPC
jgi:hypothetical protein